MLFIVSTPIGNMQDITLRALEVLKSVDIVVCEDTRVTGKLLHHFSIDKPMKVLNEFNEENAIYDVITLLQEGKNIALVSDAGTPLISDPGFRLVQQARLKNLLVSPIPGPSALIAALSVAGLPTDSFYFHGFLPKKKNKIESFLLHFKNSVCNKEFCPTLVVYESPHRIITTLQIMLTVFGDREITIVRELTKIHEEFKNENISTLISNYSSKEPKGEIVMLISLKR